MFKLPRGDAKTYRCGGNCTASEVLCLPQVISASVGGRLHGLLPFRDRRVRNLLYLGAELCHGVIGVTGDAGSLSLVWPPRVCVYDLPQSKTKRPESREKRTCAVDAACSATPFVCSAVACTCCAASGDDACCASARAAVVVSPAWTAPLGKCGWACTGTSFS